MKKKGKQFFSLLLSAVIVLTLLPTITLKASAADAPSIAEKYSNFAYHFPHATGVAVDSDNHVYVSDDRGLEEQGSVYYYKEVAQSSCIKYYNNYLYVGDYINSRIAASCTIISSSTDNNNIPFHSWSKPDYTGDLAFDSSSDIFFVEGNTLYRKSVDSSGMVVNTTDHFSYPGEFSDYDGLAADNARNVYVADYSNSVIEKFDFSGDCSVIANVRARHLVLDSNGNLYANGDGKLYRIDTLGNVVTILSSGVSNNGMCFYNDTKDKNANNSHILIANSATNAVDEATFPTPTSSTTLSVSVNKSSIVSGSSATLTATGLQPAATGTVTFKSSGGTVLGTAQVSGGTASCDTATTLPIGNYNDITAVYSGDVNYLGTSSTLASTFIVTGTTPTALTASVRDSSVMYGTPVSLMSSGLPTAATGTVTFTNSDGTVLGTAAVSNGAANCVTKSNLAVGTYNVTAAYCGDSTYEPSNATTSFTVTSAVTTITLFENIPSAASDSSGSVTFTVEGIQSNATATVEFSATNGAQTVSLTSGTLSSGVTSGQFTVPISSFKAICGDYTVTATASYHGSSSYASSSATVHFAITGSGDPSFTVPSSASFNLNDPVVLTASTGHTDATGTVTFTDYAGNLIGSAPLSGGKAQCTLNSGTFPTGSTNTIYVVYYGDSTYEGATESYTVTITSLYSAGFSVSSTTNPFVVRADNFPSDATGSVSFKLKSGNYSQTATGVQISNGSAVFAVTRNFNGMSDGTCIITATYSPDTTAKSKYASTSQTANMTIVKAAPQFTSADNADFTVGSPGTFTVSTANYPLAALTETGTLPTGVTFTDNKNGTATIAGIPTTKGSSTFTITAANGTSPDATQQFTLTVQPDNSMVSPGIASFDKNIGSTGYADIPVTLALNGNTFSGIYIGETQVDSANYTVSADGKTVTLKKEYLAGLSTGDTALTFRFNGGNDATLTVTVSGAFVAVTSITGVPTTATAGTDLTLSGTVNPATATNQTITWTLKSAGTTGATVTNGVLSTTTAGTATVTATVANGTTSSTDYTQDFDITVSAATPAFVAVTGITGVPTTATAGTDLTLSGTVNPATATNQTITWTLKSAGTTGASVSNGMLSTTAAGTATVTATVTNGATSSTDYTHDFDITVSAATPAFVAVTGITGVPTTATAGTDLTLSGTVNPATATNQTITWTLKSAGTTGATVTNGVLSTTAAGTATVTATVANGTTSSTDYTHDFDITVSAPFVAVTSITGVPTTATAGTDLTLSGTVNPATATNKTITWTLKSAGTTGATVTNGVLSTTAAGTATVTATVANGTTSSTDYTQDFDITVSAATPAFVAVTGITGVPTTATAGTDLTLSGTVNPATATNQTITWTLKSAGTTGATVTNGVLSTTAAGTATVTATVANGTTSSTDYTQDFDITVSAAEHTYGISLSQTAAYTFTGQTAGYSTLTSLSVTITSTGNQATGDLTVALSGDNTTSFTLSKTTISSIAESGTDSFTVTPVTGLGAGTYTAAVTVSGGNVTAQTFNVSFTVGSSGNPGGGTPSGGGSSASPSSNITVSTNNNTATASQTLAASTGSNGVAAASATSSQISEMLAAAEAKAPTDAQAAVNLQVQTGSGATGVSVTLPQSAVTALTSGEASLTVSSSVATVTLDSATLAEISKHTSGDVTITATAADTTALSAETKTAIGTRPVYDLKITSGSTTVSSFGGGTATVSVPYTPAAGENVNAIVVYYINASGELVTVPNCSYDAKTGTVTFTTTHFSTYAVGYNKASFKDVSDNAWYANYVTYLAARGIVGGNNGTFSPDASITRAEFVTILARMSGDDLSGYKASSFSDVSADSWYFAAVQWANKAGIASGYDGKFNPNETITREQMAAMLYRYAEYKGTVSNTEGMSVREFSDYSKISSWAQAPIQWAMNNKILSGNTDGSFAPQSSATRAQAAKMLAVLLQGTVK